MSPTAGRRALLLAAPAALLSACGAEPAAPKPSDADVVARLLTVESAEESFYTVALKRAPNPLFRRLRAQERAHHAALADAYRSLTGRLPPDAGSSVHQGGLAVALGSEQRSYTAHLEALPQLRDGGLRRLVASIAAAEAEHVAVLRGELGRPQAPQAFVT